MACNSNIKCLENAAAIAKNPDFKMRADKKGNSKKDFLSYKRSVL